MEPLSDRRWVSAWSTSPIDASLSETGVLDRLGVAVTDVSARTAVLLTAGGTHVRLTLSNVFGVLPLHVAACTVAIGADDARGIDPAVAGHGCGTQFVRFYEQRARALGCPELRIDTNAKNANARRLYAYLGYREAGVAPCTFNGIDGVALVCLEKWLGAEP